MWPFKKKIPLRGLKFGDVTLEAPTVDAPAQQWLDWAALIGGLVGNGLVEGTDEWIDHSFNAYRQKWGSNVQP